VKNSEEDVVAHGIFFIDSFVDIYLDVDLSIHFFIDAFTHEKIILILPYLFTYSSIYPFMNWSILRIQKDTYCQIGFSSLISLLMLLLMLIYLSIFGIDALIDVYFDFALFIYLFIDRFIDLFICLFCVKNTKEYRLVHGDLFDNFFVDVDFDVLWIH